MQIHAADFTQSGWLNWQLSSAPLPAIFCWQRCLLLTNILILAGFEMANLIGAAGNDNLVGASDVDMLDGEGFGMTLRMEYRYPDRRANNPCRKLSINDDAESFLIPNSSNFV